MCSYRCSGKYIGKEHGLSAQLAQVQIPALFLISYTAVGELLSLSIPSSLICTVADDGTILSIYYKYEMC